MYDPKVISVRHFRTVVSVSVSDGDIVFFSLVPPPPSFPPLSFVAIVYISASSPSSTYDLNSSSFFFFFFFLHPHAHVFEPKPKEISNDTRRYLSFPAKERTTRTTKIFLKIYFLRKEDILVVVGGGSKKRSLVGRYRRKTKETAGEVKNFISLSYSWIKKRGGNGEVKNFISLSYSWIKKRGGEIFRKAAGSRPAPW